MCIAIFKPAGKWVTKEQLSNSFQANRDGAGYAFIPPEGREVLVKKGFFTFDEFWKAYEKDVTTETIAFAHFRIATKGAKNEANCHPFAIDNGVLMHNGPCVNYTYCAGDKDRSDSRQFAEDMVKTYTYEEIEKNLKFIEAFAGSEKIAFLFNDGRHLIANEKNGLWEGGCWFSNSSFRGYFQSASNYSTNYGGTYRGAGGRYGSASHTAAGSQGGQTGSTTGSTPPPKNRETIVKRSYGAGSDLFDCLYSDHLKGYVPIEITVDNIELHWSERMKAFLPVSTKNNLSSDERYVYEATDTAMAKTKGPDLKVDSDWLIIADQIGNEAHLRLFLREAKNTPRPVAPAPAPAASTTTTALTTEVAGTPATPAADASAAPAGETVH